MLQPIKDIFKAENFPDLLVGLSAADDAAVYRLDEERAIVTTIDFFPPVVDDPYDFGAIAAANALSDIYAMGGKVLFAINLLAYPDDLDKDIVREILRGGAETVAEAGGVIAGGHSVTDKEPKYGLAVTGLVHPDRIMTKGGSKPGDAIFLTKPLGAGVVTTALKQSIADAVDVEAAVASMKLLNKDAALVAQVVGATSATDITGFGLTGHAHEMAHLGHVAFRISTDKLPWLPGAIRYAGENAFPGGTWRNKEFFEKWTSFAPGISQVVEDLLFTPETSGGLLLTVPQSNVAAATKRLPDASLIGIVTEGDGQIEFV